MAKEKAQSKQMACCQEVIDSAFAFMHSYNNGSDFQKGVTKRRFGRSLDKCKEMFFDAKVIVMNQKTKSTNYSVNKSKTHQEVTSFQKPK